MGVLGGSRASSPDSPSGTSMISDVGTVLPPYTTLPWCGTDGRSIPSARVSLVTAFSRRDQQKGRLCSFIPSQIRHQIWTTGDSAPGAFPRKTQTRGQRKQNNLIDRISRRILASDQWIQSMTRPGRTWTIRAVNPRSFRIRSPLSSIESPQAARATEPPNTDLAPENRPSGREAEDRSPLDVTFAVGQGREGRWGRRKRGRCLKAKAKKELRSPGGHKPKLGNRGLASGSHGQVGQHLCSACHFSSVSGRHGCNAQTRDAIAYSGWGTVVLGSTR
ncbi:hypothetical protein B0J15DRAFT_474485 [Fusarium solani]|uniref:Uncharacterized protein n=1 Tax=Fusarium solani TaxID=169388 RepID=A0A9P9RE73_FUSSL|nr:uncharacterized protein B0J15DRAFT_474485 [Fusarium solani]KAH7275243.1 hypothetical protein B0J15DRAFT_474485 [Fusarium solani]